MQRPRYLESFDIDFFEQLPSKSDLGPEVKEYVAGLEEEKYGTTIMENHQSDDNVSSSSPTQHHNEIWDDNKTFATQEVVSFSSRASHLHSERPKVKEIEGKKMSENISRLLTDVVPGKTLTNETLSKCDFCSRHLIDSVSLSCAHQLCLICASAEVLKMYRPEALPARHLYNSNARLCRAPKKMTARRPVITKHDPYALRIHFSSLDGDLIPPLGFRSPAATRDESLLDHKHLLQERSIVKNRDDNQDSSDRLLDNTQCCWPPPWYNSCRMKDEFFVNQDLKEWSQKHNFEEDTLEPWQRHGLQLLGILTTPNRAAEFDQMEISKQLSCISISCPRCHKSSFLYESVSQLLTSLLFKDQSLTMDDYIALYPQDPRNVYKESAKRRLTPFLVGHNRQNLFNTTANVYYRQYGLFTSSSERATVDHSTEQPMETLQSSIPFPLRFQRPLYGFKEKKSTRDAEQSPRRPTQHRNLYPQTQVPNKCKRCGCEPSPPPLLGLPRIAPLTSSSPSTTNRLDEQVEAQQLQHDKKAEQPIQLVENVLLFCMNCTQYICANCAPEVHNSKITANHKLLIIDQLADAIPLAPITVRGRPREPEFGRGFLRATSETTSLMSAQGNSEQADYSSTPPPSKKPKSVFSAAVLRNSLEAEYTFDETEEGQPASGSSNPYVDYFNYYQTLSDQKPKKLLSSQQHDWQQFAAAAPALNHDVVASRNLPYRGISSYRKKYREAYPNAYYNQKMNSSARESQKQQHHEIAADTYSSDASSFYSPSDMFLKSDKDSQYSYDEYEHTSSRLPAGAAPFYAPYSSQSSDLRYFRNPPSMDESTRLPVPPPKRFASISLHQSPPPDDDAEELTFRPHPPMANENNNPKPKEKTSLPKLPTLNISKLSQDKYTSQISPFYAKHLSSKNEALSQLRNPKSLFRQSHGNLSPLKPNTSSEEVFKTSKNNGKRRLEALSPISKAHPVDQNTSIEILPAKFKVESDIFNPTIADKEPNTMETPHLLLADKLDSTKNNNLQPMKKRLSTPSSSTSSSSAESIAFLEGGPRMARILQANKDISGSYTSRTVDELRRCGVQMAENPQEFPNARSMISGYKCPQHQEEPVHYFCLECEVACFCGSCILERHHLGHEVLVAKEAWESIKSRKLRAGVQTKLERLIDDSLRLEPALHEMRGQTFELILKTKLKVEDALTSMIQTLQSAETNMVSDTESLLDVSIEEIDKRAREVERLLASLIEFEEGLHVNSVTHDNAKLCAFYHSVLHPENTNCNKILGSDEAQTYAPAATKIRDQLQFHLETCMTQLAAIDQLVNLIKEFPSSPTPTISGTPRATLPMLEDPLKDLGSIQMKLDEMLKDENIHP